MLSRSRSRVRRLLIVLALLVPMVALADDASTLGPQTSTGAASIGSSSSLQPNGATSLQNGGSASSLGGSQSDAQSALQRPATSDEAKLFIQGEASSSGSPKDDSLPWYSNLIGLVLAVVAFGTGLWLWQRRAAAALITTSPRPVAARRLSSSDSQTSTAPTDARASVNQPTQPSSKRRRKSMRR